MTTDEKKGKVFPLRQALIEDTFWKAWENMDEKARTAVLLGEIRNLETRIAEMQEQIDEVKETIDEIYENQ